MKEEDIVLCTVEQISGTTVFVKIENNGEGTIVVSEIAPGRIRNLRDYVVPGKKIVCKILRVEQNNIILSLRRVGEKERKEVMDRYDKEKSSLSILKSVLGEKAPETAEKIKKKEKSIYEFLQNCKAGKEKLEEYMTKEEAERVCNILQEKKEKQVEVKKEFVLESLKSNGIILIKKILLQYKEKISYLSAGKFSMSIKSLDYKKANQESDKILAEIEKDARKENCKFEIKK